MKGWLDKYQEGGVAKTDATRVAAPALKLTKAQLEKNKAINKQVMVNTEKANAKKLSERKNAMAESNDAGVINPNGKRFAIGDKFRMFPNDIGGYGEAFDDFINPFVFTGNTASGLGNAMIDRDPKAFATEAGMALGAGALGFDPLGGAMKVPGKVAQSMESGLLSNAYKINPFAISENPEMYLYRAQPENFNTQNTIDFMRQELLANRSKPWYKSVINSYEEGHPSLVAQNDFHGSWYESNPERLDWYLHSGDKVDVGTPMEILRGKINKNSSSKFSIKNNPKANPISLSPETEFVVPKNITESFEKFPESSWKKLIEEDKKFNTPHWLKGYKEVPKPSVDFSKYLTQEEAIAARAKRLISQKDKPGWNEQLTPDLETRLNNAVKNHDPASNYPGEKLGSNILGRTATLVSKDANLSGVPLTEANKARVAAHETGHYYSNSFAEGEEWLKPFNLNKLESYRTRTYLRGKSRSNNYANEIRERAAQLKDYIAQKNKIPLNQDFKITQAQLDDSIKNYVKDTGLDNTMSKMLGALKDKKGLLKTMNKYALGAAPVGIVAGALQQKKENGGWLDKYNDGGPIQPNYNDASTSAGPEFQGDGYSNVGRNYSPAWGGQFQDGGKVPATKQDSLNLYNNAKKVLNYYSNKNYRKDSEDYSSWEGYNEWVHNHNKTSLTVFNSSNKVNANPSRVPLASGKSANMVLPESTYYKKLDDNRYMQREHNSAILDTRAPMQLFDKRVVPTMEVQYDNINIKDTMYGDMVGIYGYDPVLVKPASMLTPQERALRIERYGEASGLVNTKPKPKPTTKTKSEVKLKPQSKPIPTPQSTIDFMEGNYAQEPITEIPQPQPQASAYGEVVDPRTGYTHMTRQGSTMYPMVSQKVPEMAMGGSLPGATGFMYARVGAPSNGKYAKKTKASAQNGAEMKFYQEGLDFKPKSISKDGSKVIKDDRGQWAHPGEITEIGSNQITMQGVPYPVMGISDTGDMQMMYPNQEYQYDGESVTEYPMMQDGGVLDSIVNVGKGAVKYVDNLIKTGINKLSAMDEPDPNIAIAAAEVESRRMKEKFMKEREALYPKSVYDKLIELNDDHPKTVKLDKQLNRTEWNKEGYDIGYANDKNRIKLNTGRFTGANVSSRLIDDIAEAAKRNNIPIGQLLTLAGRESTFGEEKGKNFRYENKNIYTSGWDVANDYRPYDVHRFLADKKVPGVSVEKNSRGYTYNFSDSEKAKKYMNSHPELLQEYKKKLDSTPDIGNKNFFDLSAEFLKKKGIKGYNPGDPNYEKMFNQDYDILKQDKALMSYLKKKGYKYEQGGQLTKLDQLTNFTNYNTKQPGGWLDKYQ